MKKLLLLFVTSMSSVAMAQVTIPLSYSPATGCPNSTHNITVDVTNNTGTDVASGTTLNLVVKDNSNATIGTTTIISNTVFANGDTRSFVISSVNFGLPMTCKVSGTITVMTMMVIMGVPTPFTYTVATIPAQDYIVQYPADLTITNTGANLSVSTPLNGNSVRYYRNGNYSSVVDESTTGNFTTQASGSYTAKALDLSNSCVSENPSNAIVISVTAIKEAKGISVSVYPNPVTSSVTIETGSASSFIYDLSDLSGTILTTSSFQERSSINMEALQAGSYILTIKDGKDILASYKLVK